MPRGRKGGRTPADIEADALRTGRPKKKNPRDHRAAIAISKKERQRAEKAARKAGVTLGVFIRGCLLYCLDQAESENGIDFQEGEE